MINQKNLELQILRGIAVLCAVIFHFWPEKLPGGFLGVDVFFVISGFLMVVMLDRYEKINAPNIVNFYIRRLLRLYPALVVVSIVSIFLSFLLNYEIVDNFFKSARNALLGISNFQFWKEAGYFDISSNRKPLLHTWSLSVEIQFYLIAPLLYAIIKPLINHVRWGFFVCLIFLTIGSLTLARQFPGAGFYLMPFRVWEFLAGMTVALIWPSVKNHSQTYRIFDNSHFKIGLSAIIATVLFADGNNQHPGLVTLIIVMLTSYCIVISLNQTEHKSYSLLDKCLIFLGKYSFSIYLWHYPILIYVTIYIYPSSLTIFSKFYLLIFILGISIISQKFIEEPIAKIRGTMVISLSALVASFSLVIVVLTHILPFSHFIKSYKHFAYGVEAKKAVLLVEQTSIEDKLIREKVNKETQCIFQLSTWTTTELAKITRCHKQYGEGIAVFGDSHAHDLYLWLALQEKNNFVVSFTRAGCRLEPSIAVGCIDYDKIVNSKGY